MTLCPETARPDEPLLFVAFIAMVALLGLLPTYHALVMVRRRKFVFSRDGRAIEGRNALIVGTVILVLVGVSDLIVLHGIGCTLYLR